MKDKFNQCFYIHLSNIKSFTDFIKLLKVYDESITYKVLLKNTEIDFIVFSCFNYCYLFSKNIALISNDLMSNIFVLRSYDENKISLSFFNYFKVFSLQKAFNLIDCVNFFEKNNVVDMLLLVRDDFENIDYELAYTIKTLIESNLANSLAANRLFIHRNTLLYRYEIFKQKYNLNIKDIYFSLYFLAFFKLKFGS